ncbi:MAG: methionyl-tRNA formyltransferase [bacterium]|nr:methionyl-tRNA formyltransferase [bacterium]
MSTYAIATTKGWNLDSFAEIRDQLPGQWHLMTNKKDLTLDRLEMIKPRYLFFPHWSWIVPSNILNNCECVLFHMTDVPYGRGGSPLQNLIALGHKTTMLSAIRMVKELDAGPVYMKRELNLSGSAEQIFRRAGSIIMQMIEEIVTTHPEPVEQTGEVTLFKRRTPDMSQLSEQMDQNRLYDHIRMLDAPGYPNAFMDFGDMRMEFYKAKLDGGILRSNVKISYRKNDDGKA